MLKLKKKTKDKINMQPTLAKIQKSKLNSAKNSNKKKEKTIFKYNNFQKIKIMIMNN